jgi:hypothetical protein
MAVLCAPVIETGACRKIIQEIVVDMVLSRCAAGKIYGNDPVEKD